MALSQKGASYVNRAEIQNKFPLLARALDDLASKTQAVSSQTNASTSGTTSPPESPQALAVSASAGFANLQITHNSAPAGTAYLVEYSSAPNFPSRSTVRVDNGISKSWSQYLKGQTLYFRAASTFYTSEPSNWIYFGTEASPTPVIF